VEQLGVQASANIPLKYAHASFKLIHGPSHKKVLIFFNDTKLSQSVPAAMTAALTFSSDVRVASAVSSQVF
jgi:hypothetical protein